MDILQELIYPVVDEVRNTLEKKDGFNKSPDTPLWGVGSSLDSLGLVSFIVAVEGQVEQKTGTPITLASEKAMSRKNSPFRTLGTLATYINELLANPEKNP